MSKLERIYLDHAATTPIHPDVVQTILTEMNGNYGNPSSIHSFGRQAHKTLEESRQLIAANLNVKPHEIIFNSGGTEGDNTAIIQTALSREEQGKHIITTAIEHPAVLQSMAYLSRLGYDVTYLDVNEQGQISLSELKEALREETILVSIMYGNNEIGNILPIKEIGALLKEHPAVFHTDAVQAFGSESIDPHELAIDLLSISAHKINGPKGVGFLYKNDAISFPSFMRGGEQEEKRRAGTENLAGIAGMATAVDLLTDEKKQQQKEQYRHFQNMLLSELKEAAIDFEINGDREHNLAHILNLWLKGIPSELLLMQLDLQGIAISTGSACTAGTIESSHVLEAMYGKGHPAVNESVRISFGLGNTENEIRRFSETLIKIIKR